MAGNLDSTNKLLNFSGRNDLKNIYQNEAAECGLACLAMISSFFGHDVDLNSLRRKFPISLKGLSLQDLMSIAQELNLSSRAVKLEVGSIRELAHPCILHWDMNHFVVLKKTSKNNITILDPASGERKVGFDEVSRRFTGVALEILPTKEFTKGNSSKKLRLSDLWSNIIGLKRSLFQILMLSLMLQVFMILSPFYMQLVVDDVVISNDRDLLTVLLIAFLLLVFVNVGIGYLRSFVILILGSQISLQIANNLFSHLIRLPLEWFQKRHIGDVVSRFSSLDNIKDLLTTGIIEAVVDGIMIVGTLVMMFVYDGALTWLVLVAFFLYFVLRLSLYRTLRALSENQIRANAIEDTNFMETIRATQAIKLFGKETQRHSLWQNYYAKSINTNIQLKKLTFLNTAANGLIFGVENVVIIYLAASSVMEGHFSVGMLFAFLAYKQQFIGKASSLLDKFIDLKMLDLHLSRIGDIALTKQSAMDTAHSFNEFNSSELMGEIELVNVSFRYSISEPYVIKNLSLKIRQGETVAITGPSGCGKTTLMKIMLGLLEPDEGDILIDGNKMKASNSVSYRKQIAAVMQDDSLLSGSISDNICFFEPKYSQKEIEHAASLAKVHDDISKMPMAYFSLIGDMGNALSGGQRQRIMLARALYRKPKVLFLDEATSHLDVQMEIQVNESIRKLEITKIVIAHRPETIKSAERVITLNRVEQDN